MDGIKTFVYELIISMLNGFDDSITGAKNILTENIFNLDNGMYVYALDVLDVIKPIAYTIISICFLIDFIKMIVKMDVLKFEFLLRVFLKLVLAKAAIDITAELLIAIYSTGSNLILETAKQGGTSTLGTIVSEPLMNIMTKMGWIEAIALLASMFISFLAMWVTGIIVYVIAYSRMIEILIMVAVSPIPVAFLPLEENGNSMAKHFFMSFAGVVLQGLFIIIAIKLYSMICIDVFNGLNVGDDTWGALAEISSKMLLGALVLIMTVIKSGSWAKSILNAA